MYVLGFTKRGKFYDLRSETLTPKKKFENCWSRLSISLNEEQLYN